MLNLTLNSKTNQPGRWHCADIAPHTNQQYFIPQNLVSKEKFCCHPLFGGSGATSGASSSKKPECGGRRLDPPLGSPSYTSKPWHAPGPPSSRPLGGPWKCTLKCQFAVTYYSNEKESSFDQFSSFQGASLSPSNQMEKANGDRNREAPHRYALSHPLFSRSTETQLSNMISTSSHKSNTR